jgi:hypothetical protein
MCVFAQLHQRLDDLGLDAHAFALQPLGRCLQPVRHAAELAQHAGDAGLGADHGRRLALRRRLGADAGGVDRGADDLDLLGHATAGFAGHRGQFAHLLRQHPEAAAAVAGMGGLDRGIDGQQVGLGGDVRDVGRHLLQLVDEAVQVLDLGVHGAVAGHRSAQRVEHAAQCLAAVLEDTHQALLAALRRRLQGLVEPLHDGAEALRQRTDGHFHLGARILDMGTPDRQQVAAQPVGAGNVAGGGVVHARLPAAAVAVDQAARHGQRHGGQRAAPMPLPAAAGPEGDARGPAQAQCAGAVRRAAGAAEQGGRGGQHGAVEQ